MDVKDLLRHQSTHQTNKYLHKEHRKNEAVNILSSVTAVTGKNEEVKMTEEKGDVNLA